MSQEFYTVMEASEILKVTPQTIRAMCNRRQMRCLRIGTGKFARIRIPADALEQLQDEVVTPMAPAATAAAK